MPEIHKDDAILMKAAKEFGTPSYVYLLDRIEERIAEIDAAFGSRFALSYAVKSNPNPQLLRWLHTRIDTLDISSIGEMRLGVQAGWEPKRMSFTGPGKRDAELVEAIEAGLGELVVESVDEAIRADRFAAAAGVKQDILIRIGPNQVPKGFGDQMAGRPSAFGIDYETMHEEVSQILALEHLRVTGLHIYSGTQCLVPSAICENYREFLRIFSELSDRYDLKPEKLIFGSGLGIPYFENDEPLDLVATAGGIVDELDVFRKASRYTGTKLVLEIGRYMVGEAGYYLTSVTRVKDSRGTRIGICDGGMNNHLPASGNFGMVIHRNYRMHKVGGGVAEEKVNLAGPLCTPLDRIGVGVHLPRVSAGDVIAVHSSGAYGLTASPIHFISHDLPREFLIEGDQIRDVTRSLGDFRK